MAVTLCGRTRDRISLVWLTRCRPLLLYIGIILLETFWVLNFPQVVEWLQCADLIFHSPDLVSIAPSFELVSNIEALFLLLHVCLRHLVICF